jgi:hypothetical protein
MKSLWAESCDIPVLKKTGGLATSPQEKAEVLSSQFASVFSDGPAGPLPLIDNRTFVIDGFLIKPEGVLKLLLNLDVKKSVGPDLVSPRVLKECAQQLAGPLAVFFNLILLTGFVPDDWKTAIIHPLFKKGSRFLPANYRPISLTSCLCKIFEHIVSSQIHKFLFLHNLIDEHQHGFRSNRSCEGAIVSMLQDWAAPLDRLCAVDAVFLDFSKAFDTVPHRLLTYKLEQYGICGPLLKWIGNFLTGRTQRVRVNNELSKVVQVTSGVPQGSVLGPLLFLLYINDITKTVRSKMNLFADDCVIYSQVYSNNDIARLQTDLDALCQWSLNWGLRFNVNKCHHLRAAFPQKYYPLPLPIISCMGAQLLQLLL